MFGNKEQKQERLVRLVALVRRAPKGITQAELARQLQVTRATIHKDLVALEELDVRLAEDDQGRLCLPADE